MTTHSVFTVVTPLPSDVTRAAAVAILHDHATIIDLNPLVVERHRISPPPPADAPPSERECEWWSVTDRVANLGSLWPGGGGGPRVSFTCAFHDLARGTQTHVRAPLGVDIRETWAVGGALPGEEREPVELGLGAPAEGLYLREDVDLRCNFVLAPFVRRTLKTAHAELVKRLVERARRRGDGGVADEEGAVGGGGITTGVTESGGGPGNKAAAVELE